MNVVTLKSVELDKFSFVDEYLSETKKTLEVSSHEDINIAQNKDDETEKEIVVICKRPEEPQKNQERITSDIEVQNELPCLKEGVLVSLPKAVDMSFVVHICVIVICMARMKRTEDVRKAEEARKTEEVNKKTVEKVERVGRRAQIASYRKSKELGRSKGDSDLHDKASAT
ncbi:hypothetical protein Sjap_015239 [Stephania japonica]|uniref:Uncharacterized protein n=1 Tax=Stephania japonica TaxID=461633 RepID=A0AAP0IJ12_9MAGN